MKRCIIIFVLMLLLFCAPVFASTLFGESTSEESWVLEHSSVNNDNKYWDVMLALSSDPPNKEYSAAADNELLRIRTNYGRTYTDDKYRKVTITPDNGSWVLTSDYNATVTRAYTFDLYEIAWTRSGSNQTAVANEDPTKITGTSSSTEYSFTMKAAEWETLGTDYAKKFYDYEIVLRLPELTQTERERLEPGDYHATFTVSLYTGSKGGSAVSYSYTIKAGYAGTGAGVRPLAKDPDVQFTKADFFNQFFGGNDWERYVSDVQTGSMEAMKVGKEYKVSAVVSVNVKLLRQHLEKAGVIRGLASGF